MNLSLGGIAVASIVGLLVAWLFLSVYQTQHNDFRAVESQVSCEKARFDVKFGAGDFSAPDPSLVARADRICDEQDKRLAARSATEAKSEAEREQVQTTIQSVWSNPTHERERAKQ